MPNTAAIMLTLALSLTSSISYSTSAATPPATQRNVIIFVADGLRPDAVNPIDAPTIFRLRNQGVYFANSHSMYPTFTTPNASALATGHYLGDTGDFGNVLYAGYPLFNSGNFGKSAGSNVAFVENDWVLGDLNDHFEGNYLGEETLLSVARAAGYSTAAIGKLGPTAIQDVEQLAPTSGRFAIPETIIIDDSTGAADGVPLSDEMIKGLKKSGLPAATPVRVQPAGDNNTPGIRSPNWGQQVYFIEAITRVVLPLFSKRKQPFMLVYWSRDPDGTQHSQGDSFNRLSPGINGPTSRAAVQNVDNNLKQLMEYIQSQPTLAANTDIVMVSDHGFATISKQDIDAQHHHTASFAASGVYSDVPSGFLPPGFLAIDLAHYLNGSLFDPDSPLGATPDQGRYRRVKPDADPVSTTELRHPLLGNGLIGSDGGAPTTFDVVVAANGGSDLIYVPDESAERVNRIVQFLVGQDYVGAIFVNDRYGAIPGTLPMSTAALIGSANLPTPAIVVSFKSFTLDQSEAPAVRNALLRAVQIADTPLQQGQGMHGSLSRDNTFNFLAAYGPDFKTHFVDHAPASNADVVPTIAQLLQLTMPARGALRGRILHEALRDGPRSVAAERCLALSPATGDGRHTILEYQRAAERLYLDQATFRVPAKGEHAGCAPLK